MGASSFRARAKGKTAEEAFRNAVADAGYESGHGGYSGTIAEKHDFILYPLPQGMTPRDLANKMLEDETSDIYEKWGPAGCVKSGEDEWLFFGYASD